MDIGTAKKIVDSIYDYMLEKKLSTFAVILHGGEPLLWSIDNFEFLLSYVAKMNLQYALSVNLIIQTNGFKINSHLIQLLKAYKIPIGISIDGPVEIHDKFRVTHNNKPTYHTIIENLYKIVDSGYDKEYIGLLSVVNPCIDAPAYFDWVKTLPINRINVLWPIEFNYNNTPWDYYNIKKEK